MKYVYIHTDENGRPEYVGQGGRYRPFSRSGSRPDRPDPSRVLVSVPMSQESAWALEALCIRHWGRKKYDQGGILKNRAAGGRGSPGVPTSELARQVRKENIKACLQPEVLSKRGATYQERFRVHWSHPVHGVVYATPTEMAKRYGGSLPRYHALKRGDRQLYNNWSLHYVG
jgi:hypothetical protein